MNAIGYTRLSTKDQSKYSLGAQEESIKNYCLVNRLELVALFKDNGECSDTFERADFLALEAFIRKHKGKVRYLIIMAHDRFSRDLSEALLKIKELEKKFGIKVLSIDEPVDLDTADPDVFLNRAFKYLMANQELLQIRKRTRRGIRNALESGRFVNMAPFGYKNEREVGGKGILVLVEEKADIIRDIFKKFLMNIPMGQIYAEAKKAGLTMRGNSTIPRILRNCVYAGLIKVPATQKVPERYVPAIHAAIISETEFWLAQQILNKQKPNKVHLKDEFPLRGVLKCWCGHHMTAAWSKGKTKEYLYYFCKYHRKINLSGVKLHKQFDQILSYLSLTQTQIEALKVKVEKKYSVSLEAHLKLLKVKEQKLKEIEKSIDRLEERFMKDEIEHKTYRKWNEKYNIEKAVILNEVRHLHNGSEQNWNMLKDHLHLLTDVPKIYHSVSVEKQQLLLKMVFEHDLVYLNGAVRTPTINPALSHNSLILKEKGLLCIEQPNDFGDKSPVCSP